MLAERDFYRVEDFIAKEGFTQMRILFIAPNPPSRIRVRSYGFLSQLRHQHQVTLLVQISSSQELADAEALQRQGYEVITVHELQYQAMLRCGMALFGSRPLQVAYANSERFLQAARHLCTQRSFDVIHVEHLRGIASVGKLAQKYPLVWDAVDCISLLFQQTAKAGHSLPVRTMASLEYRRTQQYEAGLLKQLRHVVTISERDRQALLDLHYTQAHSIETNDEDRTGSIHVIPSGVDLAYFHPVKQKRIPYNIVFSGKMSYHANVAAALYLYNDIMPLVWEQQPQATLTLVGSKPPKALQRLASDRRVNVTDYVEDIRPYIQMAQVMVSPMVYSVGLQNKVLEAMALGTPTVVTTPSAKALKAFPGTDILLANSAQEFAEAILLLFNEPELHEKMSIHGQRYVKQQHDWRVATEQLVTVYQQSIASFASTISSQEIFAYSHHIKDNIHVSSLKN